jgi:hypothetical protein
MLQAGRSQVIEFFSIPNPSSCTMAPGGQPLTEMNTRKSFREEGKGGGLKYGWPVRLTTSLPSMSRLSENLGFLLIFSCFQFVRSDRWKYRHIANIDMFASSQRKLAIKNKL